MSSPQPGEVLDTTMQNTPVTVTPSPLDMPGAKAHVNPPITTMTAPTELPVSPPETKPAETTEGIDPARFKGVQELARKFEKTAKDNYEDAERYRKIVQQVSGDGNNNTPDPLAAIEQLRREVETERTERLREKIARETGVPPTQIVGADEDGMKASAAQALEWAKSIIQQQQGVPLVAPAANVTSSQAPHQNGVQQIQSRDQLKTMSQKQIMDAYRTGQLDHLLGKE